MNDLVIALIVFACLSASALLGSYVRERLPSQHLSDDSVAVLKLATGLIATMSALVLGLLVSSAKNTFDTANAELEGAAAKVIQFDRLLARYGPDTQGIRTELKHNYAEVTQVLATRDRRQIAKLDSPPKACNARSNHFLPITMISAHSKPRHCKTWTPFMPPAG